MGLFDRLFGHSDSKKELSWEEQNAWDGSEKQECPRCGGQMTKRYSFSGWWCDSCHAGLESDDDEEESDDECLSVYEAAEIWASHGKDEDYTFGYTEDELESAL